MQAQIITDHKWRQFKYRNEVPERVLANQLDWTTEEQDDFYFQYRGWWYHLDDFEVPPKPLRVLGYEGWHADSFFSGTAIKIDPDRGLYMPALVMV